MSTLVAIVYPSLSECNEALALLKNRRGVYQKDIKDAIIAHCQEDGSVKMKQMDGVLKSGAIKGIWWGSLIGLLIAGPIGLVMAGTGGAAFGALTDLLKDVDIENDFVERLKSQLKPGHCVLFLLISEDSAKALSEDLQNIGGKLITTTLSEEQREFVQRAISKQEQL